MIEWLGTSFFSFLEGASSPEEIFLAAAERGYAGLCLADRMGIYGCVQALRASDQIRKELPDFFYAPGIRLHFDTADPLFVYPLHKKAYSRLCKFLSHWAIEGMALGEKGLSPLSWRDFKAFLKKDAVTLSQDFILISVSGRFYPWSLEGQEHARLESHERGRVGPSFSTPPTEKNQIPFFLLELVDICGAGARSALQLAYPINFLPGLEQVQAWLEKTSLTLKIPLLATTLPLYTDKSDQDLCDLVTAIRHRKTLKDLGYFSQANGERRLFSPQERFRIQAELKKRVFLVDPFDHGHALKERHNFSLRELKYSYPQERIPQGESPSSYLRRLTLAGAHERYPAGIPESSQQQLNAELKLIEKLKFEDYFLTIFEILAYARKEKILFQGRGSAANSAVCYCLGITAIDPVQMNLLFERFISQERHEPPDIDVDFEHERREEVIQEIYSRYGRRHAAMVASLICFRGRMAVRASAKALGLSLATINNLIAFMGREGISRLLEPEVPEPLKEILRQHKVGKKTFARLLDFAQRLNGFPRHLGLHTGGFILAHQALDEECILEPARMENRSVVPWDKNDVDYLSWMKVDLLSLGMLTALRKCFDSIEAEHGRRLSLASIPHDDARVYQSMQEADTVGVFQIESRAQMNMLPRLCPRKFYDVVIEVAIVRPGPLQGGMVHPYLRRRQGLEPVTYDHPDLKPILEKTMGVPIFQEQVMKMAVAVAGFTPGEADQLRKVMSGAWRSKSQMSKLKDKLFLGMNAKGIPQQLTERLYKQIEGFGEYGFPESHAASFAILTYVSTWVKFHYPADFLCGLLNSQPMGFYSPRSLIADAERHGVLVKPIDILYSGWDSHLEVNPQNPARPHVRLGMNLLKGLHKNEALQIQILQKEGLLSPEHEKLPTLEELRRYGLQNHTLDLLLRCKALRSFTDLNRWEFLKDRQADLKQTRLTEIQDEPLPTLPPKDPWKEILEDYSRVGFRLGSEGPHPALYAKTNFFPKIPWVHAEGLYLLPAGQKVFILGLLAIKQKPPTAGGMAFLTLEDEAGFVNLVLLPEIYEKSRLTIQYGSLLAAEAFIEKSRPTGTSPKSMALSLKVLRLWNPFTQGESRLEDRFKPRDFY